MIIDSMDAFLRAAKNASRKIFASETVLEKSQVPMIGRLSAKDKGKYAILEVPQEFADAIYDAIYEEGMEKPDEHAHISVMNKDETNQLNMPLEEDGQEFSFSLGGIESCNPEGWDEMEKVWFVKCESPQLKELRKKYGFTPLMNVDHNFHITVTVKPTPKEMKFATISKALQYLSDLTQQRVIIATDESWRKEIVQFLVDNPNPPDSTVHKWADEKGIEHSEVEAEIYKLATKAAQLELQKREAK